MQLAEISSQDAEVSSEVLTTEEVADILRVSVSHVCRLVKQGDLDKLPLGQRIIRIPRSSVNKLLGIV